LARTIMSRNELTIENSVPNGWDKKSEKRLGHYHRLKMLGKEFSDKKEIWEGNLRKDSANWKVIEKGKEKTEKGRKAISK